MLKKVKATCLTLILATAFSTTAFADSPANGVTQIAAPNDTNSTSQSNDNGTDWGWLGLLGLIGLAGLRGRDANRDHTPNH